MKKILIIVAAIILMASVIGTGTFVFAKNDSNAKQGNINLDASGKLDKAQILKRLLLIQDQTKVEELLKQAVANNKLTSDQAEKVLTFWKNNHEKALRALKRVVAWRIINIQDQSKLNNYLANLEAAGKLNANQVAKIQEFWTTFHK